MINLLPKIEGIVNKTGECEGRSKSTEWNEDASLSLSVMDHEAINRSTGRQIFLLNI